LSIECFKSIKILQRCIISRVFFQYIEKLFDAFHRITPLHRGPLFFAVFHTWHSFRSLKTVARGASHAVRVLKLLSLRLISVYFSGVFINIPLNGIEASKCDQSYCVLCRSRNQRSIWNSFHSMPWRTSFHPYQSWIISSSYSSSI